MLVQYLQALGLRERELPVARARRASRSNASGSVCKE